jgi:hypothetical protein
MSNIKLTTLTGDRLDDAALSEDFRAAEKAGPFWVGKTGFYYRDGLKKRYVPLSSIDRAFTRVQEVSTHCCCGGYSMYVYRLVLVSGGKEIVDVNVSEDEASVDKAQALLKAANPAIELGFVKPDQTA